MPHPEIVTMRRRVLAQLIAREGGAYITPDRNRQPDPALQIASIRLRGLTGIGATEAAAQADWFAQAAARAAQAVRA